MNEHTARSDDNPRPAVQRWRLVVTIEAEEGEGVRGARQAAWEAALRGCGLPVAGLDADPPRVRLSTAAPLSPTIAGEAELVDTWLVERLPRWRVREALAGAMPAGHRLVDVYDVWLGEAPLPGRVVASVYRADLSSGQPAGPTLRAAVAAMLAAPGLPRERRKGDGTVAYDLRPFLERHVVVDALAPGRLVLRMTLRHDPERGVGRPDEVLAELGDRVGMPLAVAALVREQLVLRPERPATATPPHHDGPRSPGSIPSSVPGQTGEGHGRSRAANRPAQ